MSHTPGEWSVVLGRLGGYRIWADGCAICARSEWGHRAEESRANARLIAAAPDLLAALQGLLADITEYQTINKLGGENNHWQVRARAAIAKAKP